MNKIKILFIGFIFLVLTALPVWADEEEASWLDKITLSGAVEFEAGYESTHPADGEGGDTSDFEASVEVGVGARINDHVSGYILFYYGDDEDVAIDEAVIGIDGGEKCPFDLTVGKLYLPFGNFESHMISDPLTLDIAEIRETALQVGIESHGAYGSTFVFNGDVDEADDTDDHINNFGANAGFAMETDAVNFDIGLSYINNLMDADGWEGVLEDEELMLSEFVAGMGAYAIFTKGPMTFVIEYVTALDDPVWLDADSAAINEDAVSAWNVEVGYGFDLVGKEAAVAVGYQGTDNAYTRLAETRYIGSLGIGIYDYTSLAFEYLHETFENDDEADVLTVLLAIEF